MKLKFVFILLLPFTTTIFAVEIVSLLSNLATIVGVPESIQELIKFEMEIYQMIPQQLRNDTNGFANPFEREEDKEEEFPSQSSSDSELTTSPTLDRNEFEEKSAGAIVDRPTFDMMPEGYDEINLKELNEESDDDNGLIEEPRFLGGGGCNDAFSAFAFLTFILTLLDVILELQNQGRKKRDLKPAEPDFFSETQMPNRENNFEDNFENKFEDKTNFDYREAVLAAHSLFRGFSNALAAADSQNKHVCGQMFLCEGWSEAARRGRTGLRIAKMSSQTASFWLSNSIKDFPKHSLQTAIKLGIEVGAKSQLQNSTKSTNEEDCAQYFPDCITVPRSYRFPGVQDPKLPNSAESRLFESRRKIASTTIQEFQKIAEDLYDFEKLRLSASN